jgi:tyrosine-protein phosphatase non-receptor type 23
MQYHRGLADETASKHGEALVRFQLAEKSAKEAFKLADGSSLNVTQMSPNLPADAGMCITDITKAQLAVSTERHAEAKRENDMIYNAVLPAPETLPAVDKAGAALASPIPIQDVYGTPEVQKVIGPDMFIRLVPLSVHESASVYSEEKAKLVRGEVEKADLADVEARSALDAIGVKDGIMRYKAIAEGGLEGEDELPAEVRRWKQDIGVMEDREGVAALIERLDGLKAAVKKTLEDSSRNLDAETRECETMRVKFEHLWTQEPSGTYTKIWRQDLKSHFATLEAAGASDQQVYTLWNNVRNDIFLLLSPEVEDVFRASTEGDAGQENLLDLDVTSDTGDQERARIGQYVSEIEARVSKLTKIAKERSEVLKDLKDKIQNDDVSHLLLLNRRNSGVEPTLFAAELEKFRPYQQRLAHSVSSQQTTLKEITQLWKGLKDLAGRGPGARKWEERERRKKQTVQRFSRARDGYMEVRDGLA